MTTVVLAKSKNRKVNLRPIIMPDTVFACTGCGESLIWKRQNRFGEWYYEYSNCITYTSSIDGINRKIRCEKCNTRNNEPKLVQEA